jgi:hypothetical protein
VLKIKKKPIKDYPGSRETLVLDMVRKYPVYSLDKIAAQLPGISRHSIQRILEKNNLSTVEKRLEFIHHTSTEKTHFLGNLKGRLHFGGVSPRPRELWGKIEQRFRSQPKVKWQLTKLSLLFLLVGLPFLLIKGYYSIEPPKITIDQPEGNNVSGGENLFIKGKVLPVGSRITVNENPVSLNGDGTFTAVVKVPTGESTLKLEAFYRGKRSELVRLISREPTQEELQALQDEEDRKRKEAIDRVATLERSVNDILAAKNANTEKKGILKVVNSQLKEESGFFNIQGEVANVGNQDVGWVMVTATFYNKDSATVDTKYGFATDFNQAIKPGQIAKFETQATNKTFDHYGLDLTWEEPTVAGVATQAPPPPATGSGENR